MTGRGEDIRAERRRRRSGAMGGDRGRLAVDMSTLDMEKYAYRWTSDVNNRIHDMTVNDDWEIVPDRDGKIKPDAMREGSAVTIYGGTKTNGEPLRQVLLRKPRDFHENDVKETQQRVDMADKAIHDGRIPDVDPEGQYVPNGAKSSLSVS